MSTKNVDLARIFDFEALANEPRFHLMSAADGGPGGTNDKDADYSEKLKLLRTLISEQKRPRKPNGSIYADHELLALPFTELKKLYDATPSDNAVNKTGDPSALNDGDQTRPPIKTMAAVFDSEHNLTMLSARLSHSMAGEMDAEKAGILKQFCAQKKWPVDERGNAVTVDGMLAFDVKLLQALLANCPGRIS